MVVVQEACRRQKDLYWAFSLFLGIITTFFDVIFNHFVYNHPFFVGRFPAYAGMTLKTDQAPLGTSCE